MFDTCFIPVYILFIVILKSIYLNMLNEKLKATDAIYYTNKEQNKTKFNIQNFRSFITFCCDIISFGAFIDYY